MTPRNNKQPCRQATRIKTDALDTEQTDLEPDIPDGLISVGEYSVFHAANDHALVILSMGLPYWMLEHQGVFYLCVEGHRSEEVAEQLDKFNQENRFWPPRPPVFPPDKAPSPTVLMGYAFLLISFFQLQLSLPLEAFQARGVMDGLAVFQGGEIGRALTALTLHGDLGHLVANLFSGVCFGLLINRTYGAGLGWLLIVLSGFLGNLMTGYMYLPNQHLSLGASTAIFGALGLLVGHAVAIKFSPVAHKFKMSYRLIPVLAGLMVLGWLGFGGGEQQVDVLAHVFGFLAGLPLGALGVWLLKHFEPGDGKQELCLIAVVLSVVVSWWAQLT